MDDIEEKIELPATAVDELIEHWWEDHFRGSAVARDTIAWNVAHAAKETLKRLLTRSHKLPEAKAGDDLQGSI
jgi:phytoene/squalene synthetase